MRLDLASGPVPRLGFTGVDVRPPEGGLELDLFQMPWPFESDSVTELWCSHFVEHIPDLVGFMNECYRILVPEGRITVVHPYQFSVRAWQDPTHVRALNEVSWLYYDRNWREENGLGYYPITTHFVIEMSDFTANPAWIKRAKNIQELERAARDYVNVVDDVIVRMRAVKE